MAAPVFVLGYDTASDFDNAYTLTGVTASAGDVIIVGVSGRSGQHDFDVPTWNSETFTQIASYTTDPVVLEIFALKCASSGSYNIVGNGGNYAALCATALVYSGSFGGSFFGDLVQANWSSGTYSLPSVGVANMDANSVAIDFLAATGWNDGFGGVSTTHTTNGTQRELATNAANAVRRLYASDRTGTGTVTCSYTKSDSDTPQYRIAAFRLYEAGAPSPVVDSYPATVRSGSSGNSYTTSNLTDVTAISIGTLAATSISDTSGDGTHSVPALTDGVAHELYGTRTVTVTGTGGSPTTSTSFQPATGNSFVTLSGTLNTTNTGGLFNFSPAAVVTDQIVFPSSGITYDAQGNITGEAGSYNCWHIQASTKIARSYTVTLGEGGGSTGNDSVIEYGLINYGSAKYEVA